MELTMGDNGHKANLALKLANHNEQYSRKCKKKLNKIENDQEHLKDEFIQTVKTDLKVDVNPQEIQVIHRIPGERGEPRPVIVELVNTEVKSRIMKKRRNTKKVSGS